MGVATRYWKLIAGLTLAVSLSFGGYGLLTTARPGSTGYEATHELHIRQSSWDSSMQEPMPGARLLLQAPDELLRRTPKPDVARRAAESSSREGLALTAAELAGVVTFSPSDDGRNVNLSARDLDPKRAEAMVHHMGAALIEANRERLQQRIDETSAFLETELEVLRGRLDEVEAAEWAFLREHGLNTYEELTGELRKKNEALLESQATRSEILAGLTDIESELRKNHEALPVSLSQISDGVVVDLLAELNDLRKEELALDMVFQPEYPPLLVLRTDIAEAEQMVLEAVRRYEGVGNGVGSAWDERQDMRRRHTELQLDLVTNASRMQVTQERIDYLFSKLPEFARNSHEHGKILREVEGLRTQYSKMLERDFELRAAARAGVGELEIPSPIVVGALPSPSSRNFINFIIGALVGLVVGIALAVMLDMMDTSIHGEDDIQRYLGEPIVGAIPKFRSGPGRQNGKENGAVSAGVVTLREPKSPVAEAYRSLRTNFQFATVKQQPKTVMITSAVPGEGKTTTAVNLAVTMAASGLRVLLLDCDLRRPNVHRMLRIDRSPGLSEVLTEDLDIHGVMQSTQVDNLLVVPSGHLPPNPSELIGSQRMRHLMAQLGQEFDMVICDAPSVIVVTDPILMSTLVDTTLMLVSVNYARRETIQRALGLLESSSGHLAGIVLNGIEASRRRYYYYYYYDEGASGRDRRRWYAA